MLNPRSFRQRRFGTSAFPTEAESEDNKNVTANDQSVQEQSYVGVSESAVEISATSGVKDESFTSENSGKESDGHDRPNAEISVQPPTKKPVTSDPRSSKVAKLKMGSNIHTLGDQEATPVVDVDADGELPIHIPGPGTKWNPSGLADTHLKKLACGFYGWESQWLIKVTKTSNLFYHENQDCINNISQRAWLAPQREYVDENRRPDNNGAVWELHYCNQGCSCGWPYVFKRVPALDPEIRKCANYCCQREWEVHSSL